MRFFFYGGSERGRGAERGALIVLLGARRGREEGAAARVRVLSSLAGGVPTYVHEQVPT